MDRVEVLAAIAGVVAIVAPTSWIAARKAPEATMRSLERLFRR